MCKILYVVCVSSDENRINNIKTRFREISNKDTILEVINLKGAPSNLEFRKNEYEAIGIIIDKYEEGFFNGYNSIAIGCFYDPGVSLLREMLDIPIVGAGQASLNIACQLGSRIGLIVGKEYTMPQILDNAKLYGLKDYIWGWETLDISVDDMHENIRDSYSKLIRLGKKLTQDKKCDVIVLACTALEGIYEKMTKQIGVPVIDASIAAFKFAEMMGSMNKKIGIKNSKFITYANK